LLLLKKLIKEIILSRAFIFAKFSILAFLRVAIGFEEIIQQILFVQFTFVIAEFWRRIHLIQHLLILLQCRAQAFLGGKRTVLQIRNIFFDPAQQGLTLPLSQTLATEK